MRRSATIESLRRGLHVLQFLQTNATASLHEIHLATRISKPSLLRILATLEKAGAASRRLADGRYRAGNLGRIARKPDRHDRTAEAATPVLDALCRKIAWPSDLLVPAGDHMEIRETSRPLSPFLLDFSQVGLHVGWLMTGVGRAYLAHCPDAERARIVERLRGSDKADDALAREPRRLERILAETRQRGYAIRDAAFFGGPHGSTLVNDGLAAIAVPIRGRTRVHGSLNILWISAAFTTEEFARRHLADLQAAAAAIAAGVKDAA
jgi:IclR family mhp operon transcriptional activator